MYDFMSCPPGACTPKLGYCLIRLTWFGPLPWSSDLHQDGHWPSHSGASSRAHKRHLECCSTPQDLDDSATSEKDSISSIQYIQYVSDKKEALGSTLMLVP